MYENRLYLTITNDDKELLVCCIKESSVIEKDLKNLDSFLAYHNLNYKIHCSIFEENIEHVCENIDEIRKHIIDVKNK